MRDRSIHEKWLLGLSLSNSVTSGYCNLVEKNPVELILMYLHVVIPHPSKKKKKKEQDRSEDKVSRKFTSVNASYVFFFLFLSSSLLMVVVSPHINLKNLEEVINHISSHCYSHRLVQELVLCSAFKVH